MNTTQIGDITEQKFILYCLEKEIPISKPVGNNLPYDFIIEYDNKLLKIQVKTAREGETQGTITFNTRSCSKNYNEVTTSNYIGKIDYFATCIKGKCYLVPRSECGSDKLLRFVPPKNGQVRGVNYAKDYEIEVILQKYES